MINNERDAIRNLQKYLRQLSYFDSDITPPPIDGIFELETERSVKDFQKKHGLTESGVADRETWDLIYTEYLNSVSENSLPEMLSVFPLMPKDYELKTSDSWFLVEILQYMLEELRYSYDNFENVKRSGVYDSETELAVKDFQRRNLLEETGRVNKATWNEISRQFNNNSLNILSVLSIIFLVF